MNDENDYANDTVGDPRCPFDLLCRVITVSLETMKLVRALPHLEIEVSELKTLFKRVECDLEGLLSDLLFKRDDSSG